LALLLLLAFVDSCFRCTVFYLYTIIIFAYLFVYLFNNPNEADTIRIVWCDDKINM